MYEISLVPDVKMELLAKQKLRNLVTLICVAVGGACVAVILILLSVMGAQGIQLGAQDTEIACRIDGKPENGGNCDSSYGTAVSKYQNVNELLTIQDEMKNIGALNQRKIKFSRVFGVLDVILPNDSDNSVKISEMSADFDSFSIYFNAVGWSSNNIGFRSLEAFKKNTQKSYYDYGRYMRLDQESGEYVEIPSYCIDEETDSNGITYGIYHRYAAGCEADMVEEVNGAAEGETPEEAGRNMEQNETEINTNAESEEAKNESGEDTKKKEVQDIRIRRTYKNEADKEEYKNGNDGMAAENEAKIKGYYFESKCLQYDGEGKFDEEATLGTCPVLPDELTTGDSSYGKDGDGNMVLSFTATVPLAKEIFLSANKHMQIIGPSKQNVTDSYVQIRDMFTEKADTTKLEGSE